MSTISHPTSDVPLTATGRQLLVHRLRQIETRIERLGDELEGSEGTLEALEERRRAVHELERLRHVLATARSIETIPHDPTTVEIGDAITIELEDGSREQYVVVHGIEAAVDDARISIDSPLGRALLGGRVGDELAIETDGGRYGCRIVDVSRP